MAKKKTESVDMYEQLRTKRCRASATVEFMCHAPKELFMPNFDDMPKKHQDAFRSGAIRIPCEGGGAPGVWCNNCGFAEVEED